MGKLNMTMIGMSGCGKTCYLYGTYADMLDGISGFNFFPSDYDQGLDLQNGWDSILEGVWPMGTAGGAVIEYQFDISLDGEDIGQFCWLDYRGGLLNDRIAADSDDDVKKFHNRCSETDSFLVAIPADTLLKAKENDRKANSMLMRYQTLLHHFKNINDLPVSFVITKGDLVTDKDDMQKCISVLKTKFNPLFASHKSLMICKVSLGKFLGEMVQGGSVEGAIQPRHLHLPILFAFWCEFAREAQAFRDIASGREKLGFIRGWFDDWFGAGVDPKLCREKAEEKQQLADTIWSEFVRNVDIYRKGKCILNASGCQ